MCGLPKEGSCLSHMGVHQGGGGLVKGPDRPEAVGTAGLATDRVGGSPGGLGPPPSAPLVQDGGSRGQGGREVALVWSQTQTLLWGKSTGQPLPGSPAGHGPISQGPGPSHGTPVGRPTRWPAEVHAAALSALLLALEVSPSWTGFTDGNLRRHHLPAPSSPRAPSGPSSVMGTSGLSECNSLPAPGRVPPVSAARRTGPSPALSQAHLVPDGEFPGPTHAPAGSLGTGGVGDCPSAWPVPGGYQNEDAPIRLASTQARWRPRAWAWRGWLPEKADSEGRGCRGGSSAAGEPAQLARAAWAGCWPWANAALVRGRARLQPMT